MFLQEPHRNTGVEAAARGTDVGKTAMVRIYSCAVSGFAIAMTLSLPLQVYQPGASSEPEPGQTVNRALKADRLAVVPRSAIRRPSEPPEKPVRPTPARRQLPPGCEPSFSPITVPAMAHIAGRCIG
jgi:hypothetical protein